METYIYIDWDNQECYTNWEEVVAAFRERCGGDDNFNEYLFNNFFSAEIFRFTEEQRAQVLREYEESLQADIEEWVKDCLEKVKIKVEVKGE